MRLAFDILADMTRYSLLDEIEIEKEKAVIVNEIRSIDDSPEEKGHERYLRELWGAHPLSRKITGEAEEVEKIDRERLFAFYHGRIRGTNSVIAVAGNFRVEEARDLPMDLFPPGPAAEGGLPKIGRAHV